MDQSIWIKDIFAGNVNLGPVKVQGWIRSVRRKKNFSFMVINDGSCQTNLQLVLDCDIPNYETLSSCMAGACVSIEGDLVESRGKNQSFEVIGKNGLVYS